LSPGMYARQIWFTQHFDENDVFSNLLQPAT